MTIVTGLRIAALGRANSPDFTYDLGYLGLLSIIGALLGVITCCAQSFPKFLSRMFPGDVGTRREHWDRKGPSNNDDDDKSAGKSREGFGVVSQTLATRDEKGDEKSANL